MEEKQLVLKEDQNQLVDFENMVKGLLVDDKLIVITDETSNAIFKDNGVRMFDLIGFTHKQHVPEIYFDDEGSNKVLAPDRDDDPENSFHKLIDILADMEMYVIVKRRYMKNTLGKIYALIPDKKERLFNMVELVYGNSVIFPYVEKDVKLLPKMEKSELKDKIYEYLGELDVDKDPSLLPLNPTIMDGSVYKKSFELFAKKATGQEMVATEKDVVDIRVQMDLSFLEGN